LKKVDIELGSFKLLCWYNKFNW